MKNFQKYLYILSIGVISACQYEFPEVPVIEPGPGAADFSKVVSVGDAMTAGFMDGALYNRGQQNSFANILAGQMALAGGGDFNLPDIESQNGFFGMGPGGVPLGRLILTVNPTTGATAPAPIGVGELPAPFTGDKTALNNFGVPNITLGLALIPQTGGPNVPQNPAYNPFYARFASNPGTSTIIGDAAAALANGGTFFTFWLGGSDVLGYAAGGAADPSLLTSDADFQARLTVALGSMLQANPEAKGVVANIPALDVLPYFNLVPWNALPLSEAQANQANGAYAPYNQGLAALQAAQIITQEERELRTIVFQAGQNGFVLEDETLTNLTGQGLPSIRQSKNFDKATLTLSQALGQPVGGNPALIRGISFPVEDQFVLIPSEQDEIRTKISTFNGIIASAVQANGERLVLADVEQLLDDVAAGRVNSGGVTLTASIIPPNGGFSVDGVHPNGRAHAFVANEMIRVINDKWQANIPRVNPNAYVGNDLPVGGN
ncbi:hypothetical protein [Pararhodonellum marinum]|uniref:hypothetical protein n=1 Tax=Pararhodonellum marinum TaxID=2755358 RepID=UPI00188EF134|nr:hypothetical protein [Pararhodonellum marinum]